jgi:hypothetical protein
MSRDLLELYVGAERLSTSGRHRGRGGEWDSLRAVPVRTRRRLTGAGWLVRDGLAPDQLQHIMWEAGAPTPDIDSAVTLYVRLSVAAIGETRAERYRRQFRARDRRAFEAGWRSYGAMRWRLSRGC